jgi:hypothetical protein
VSSNNWIKPNAAAAATARPASPRSRNRTNKKV